MRSAASLSKDCSKARIIAVIGIIDDRLVRQAAGEARRRRARRNRGAAGAQRIHEATDLGRQHVGVARDATQPRADAVLRKAVAVMGRGVEKRHPCRDGGPHGRDGGVLVEPGVEIAERRRAEADRAHLSRVPAEHPQRRSKGSCRMAGRSCERHSATARCASSDAPLELGNLPARGRHRSRVRYRRRGARSWRRAFPAPHFPRRHLSCRSTPAIVSRSRSARVSSSEATAAPSSALALAKACASSRSSASARATCRRSAASARSPRPRSASSPRRAPRARRPPSLACRATRWWSASTAARRSLVSSRSAARRDGVSIVRRKPRRQLGGTHLGIRLLGLASHLQLAELGEPGLAQPDAALQLLQALEMGLTLCLERGILHMMPLVDPRERRVLRPQGLMRRLEPLDASAATPPARPRMPNARAGAARRRRPRLPARP